MINQLREIHTAVMEQRNVALGMNVHRPAVCQRVVLPAPLILLTQHTMKLLLMSALNKYLLFYLLCGDEPNLIKEGLTFSLVLSDFILVRELNSVQLVLHLTGKF